MFVVGKKVESDSLIQGQHQQEQQQNQANYANRANDNLICTTLLCKKKTENNIKISTSKWSELQSCLLWTLNENKININIKKASELPRCLWGGDNFEI